MLKPSSLDWDKLRIFYAVADAGSLTGACECLGLSQSAVSRQISSLEESLQISLFHRHARGLLLTEQGDVLFRTVREIFRKMTFVEAQLKDSKHAPKGELRITTTVGFGSLWLMPYISPFMKLYPDIAVRLVLDDRELDLAMREADIAIRMGKPENPSLIQRPFVSIHYHLWASSEYLEEYGIPQTLQELDHHRIIAYGNTAPYLIRNLNWLLEAGVGHTRSPILTVNNVQSMLEATESGLGIAMLPDYVTHNNRRLINILPDIKVPWFNTYLVYPEELRNTQRITLFRDYLLTITEAWSF